MSPSPLNNKSHDSKWAAIEVSSPSATFLRDEIEQTGWMEFVGPRDFRDRQASGGTRALVENILETPERYGLRGIRAAIEYIRGECFDPGGMIWAGKKRFFAPDDSENSNLYEINVARLAADYNVIARLSLELVGIRLRKDAPPVTLDALLELPAPSSEEYFAMSAWAYDVRSLSPWNTELQPARQLFLAPGDTLFLDRSLCESCTIKLSNPVLENGPICYNRSPIINMFPSEHPWLHDALGKVGVVARLIRSLFDSKEPIRSGTNPGENPFRGTPHAEYPLSMRMIAGRSSLGAMEIRNDGDALIGVTPIQRIELGMPT